jgi:hypothetical protein
MKQLKNENSNGGLGRKHSPRIYEIRRTESETVDTTLI